ncbi:MAG: hypothetical protein DME57_05300, partial [Verrucomicrobia bacterium]
DECRFLSLKNRGRLAFCEYGAAEGDPVFFFHGWPSSRTMGELTDAAARELNVRVISADRPGICDSSFQPNRTLLDWPGVVEQLASELGIERFHILAFSGGAPYAYVTGLKMPGRVQAIAIVSGAVPFADLSDHSGLLPLYRWMIWFYRNQPRVLRALFYATRPLISWRISARSYFQMLPRPDAKALRDNAAFDVVFESQRRVGVFVWKMSTFRSACGTESRIVHFHFALLKKQRSVCPIVSPVMLKTKGTSRCRSATCTKFLRT